MEWLAKLRRKNMGKSMVFCVIFLALAALTLFGSGAVGVFKVLTPKNLEDLTPETAEGQYVTAKIYFLYGDFIEVEEYKDNRATGKITGRYYLTDFDEETYYMGLYVHQSDLAKFEEMMDLCDEFWNGYLDWDEVPEITVKGTITAMDSEELHYYRTAVGYGSEMLPLYLNVNRIGSQTMSTLVFLWVIALVLVGLGLYFPVAAGNQKELRKVLEASGSFEREAERAAAFYETTQPVCGVRMGSEFVFFHYGQKDILLRPWDVAWAYQSTTTHKVYGFLPAGKSYGLVIRTMDGKTYNLSMTQNKVQELLEAMSTALPGTVLGYSKEIESVYQNNRQSFADRWEEKVPGCTTRYRSYSPEL